MKKIYLDKIFTEMKCDYHGPLKLGHSLSTRIWIDEEEIKNLEVVYKTGHSDEIPSLENMSSEDVFRKLG